MSLARFYFKCTKCSAELAVKTDPQNSDYVVEVGATRNFEPWRDQDEELEKEKRKRDAEEMGDVMKSLENRTLDSKQEMDILAALDEMKSMKSRHATVSVDTILEALQSTDEDKERELDEVDEALIKSIFHRHKVSEDVCKPTDFLTKSSFTENPSNTEPSDGKHMFQSPAVRVIVKRKAIQKPEEKECVVKEDSRNQDEQGKNITSNGLGSLCQYGSDDDDE